MSVDTYNRATRPSSTDSSMRSGAPVTAPSRRVSALTRPTAASRPVSEAGEDGSVHTITALAGTTIPRQVTASHPTSLPVLRASVLSNR
ncbi:hypothetical protein QFZ66_007984 [Streptomyces sp. B4I13]|uniref:hypothetical protein n=1 Tax=Streptomyces sp. B4I13 TaxID=3042271 RepID=UPI002785F641|nr:hypothetical protein [Streptomyces sp. B4I13]MDQ0964106.1 hypothetical protein [Streptomyces sp. B4I13]